MLTQKTVTRCRSIRDFILSYHHQTALVLTIFNALLKPLLILLTIPVTIVTFGLFIFIINGLIIWWVSGLFSGFSIQSFGWAIVFSLVLSIVQSVINSVLA